MKLSLFARVLVSILSTLSCVSAKTGYVAIRAVEKAHTDGLSHMVDSYKARNKTIHFKTIDEWDTMSAQDFEHYDALVMVAFDCPSENPFSNSINWLPAVQNGNSIIMGTSDMNIQNSANVKEVIDSAVEFTLSGYGTGAYVSIGQMTPACLEVNGTAWITEAFQDDFDIRSIPSSNYWKNLLVAKHFSFNSLNDAMVKTVPNNTLFLPVFTQYPAEEWYPLVVNTKSLGSWTSFVSKDGSIIGTPTILIKGSDILMPGETMLPSSAPSEVPSFLVTESQNKKITSMKSNKSSLNSSSNKISKGSKKGSNSGKIRSKSAKGRM
jgi:hypothetical protein